MRGFGRFVGMLCVCLFAAGAVLNPSLVVAEEHAAKSGDKDKEAPKHGGGEGEGGEKKQPADVAGGRFAGDPIYVHLAPMVMPIITDDGLEQLVTFSIDLEVKDFNAADTIHSNMPKVMDALMRGLYGGLGQGSLRNGKMVDVNKIKKKALAALTEAIPDTVKDVLVQGVSQRML